MDQTYAYGSNGKMSKIIDAKKNGYQITYTGEKAERFIRPNGEYQQLSYGDGTTTVSSHKADGTKTAQDTMSFDKNTGKIPEKRRMPMELKAVTVMMMEEKTENKMAG